jgi:uncharacterized protein (TIGR02246 family)
VCANAEKRKSHVKSGALVMRSIALVIALVAVLIAPAFAQKAEIEAVNAKWIDFFNKGDFAGVASLYTEDATAFPPGSGMVKGRAAIEALWKRMAEQVSDPKLTTLDVKPLGPSAAREIGTFSLKTQGSDTAGSHRQISRCVGEDRKRLEARSRYLERRQVRARSGMSAFARPTR